MLTCHSVILLGVFNLPKYPMAFFKVQKEVKGKVPENTDTIIYKDKLKYVIGKDGKGYWVKPLLMFDNSYDKELPF